MAELYKGAELSTGERQKCGKVVDMVGDMVFVKYHGSRYISITTVKDLIDLGFKWSPKPWEPKVGGWAYAVISDYGLLYIKHFIICKDALTTNRDFPLFETAEQAERFMSSLKSYLKTIV